MSELPAFSSLGLSAAVLDGLTSIGYETPTPIQAATIPPLLEGRDLLGQAQTGTGKTAAFALPILSRIDLKMTAPQVLVLAPTRELAIQVAEAFQTYARNMKDFHVLPVYGGQGYDTQLRMLRRGVHVVVGTPGRVMDHIRKGKLVLDSLKTLVLDEADEMLRMGFQDDVEWILEHTPPTRQIALFSATMPREIQRVAETHLRDPIMVKIASATRTASGIRQRFWQVGGLHKLDALTRILETETFDGMIVFVRTKTATVELAEKLSARGFAAEAMNGDMTQPIREKFVERLKNGKLDILVATDVVARGLDVDRVSHVINYDIPYDTEAYIHRIGRTGRAGRSGDAILFVAPRERRMLAAIEKATGQRIEPMSMPSVTEINRHRIQRFTQRISDVLDNGNLEQFETLLNEFQQTRDEEPLKIAAALASMLQGENPLLLDERAEPVARSWADDDSSTRERRPARERDSSSPRRERNKMPELASRELKDHPEMAMERFIIDVGYAHGVKPGNIVGAIANEADLDSKYIGHIEIFDGYSVVDLPGGMPGEVMQVLKGTRICGRPAGLRRLKSLEDLPSEDGPRAPRERSPRRDRADGERGGRSAPSGAPRKVRRSPPRD